MQSVNITTKQCTRFFNFVFGDDLDFYEEFTIYLTDEQQERFFAENSEFMSEFPVSCDRMYLLRNKMFRKILRKIKE